MLNPHILLLEDDFVLSREVTHFLSQKDMKCDAVYDGTLLIKQFNLETYDLVILDINVPGTNGLEVCKTIRNINKSIPIIMLTAFGELEDKVNAFDAGADDYLVKPFHLTELFMRIKALLKRAENPLTEPTLIAIEDLEIDVSNSTVKRASREINLTPKEFKLLLLLANAHGRVVSKQYIAETIWDYNIETTNNTIEVYINFLRRKIDKESKVKLIHTKPGYGYYLKSE